MTQDLDFVAGLPDCAGAEPHLPSVRQTGLVLFLPLALAFCSTVAWSQSPYMVRDLAPGLSAGSGVQPGNLFNAGDRVYFDGQIGDVGAGLWVTDGTPEGTQALPQYCSSGDCQADFMGAVGNVVFFLTTDDDFPLWRTDGTRAGTFQLATGSAAGDTASNYAFLHGLLYFFQNGQLWRSDGTTAGTVKVTDSGGSWLVPFSGKLYYLTTTQGAPAALWSTDGTAAGTSRVAVLQVAFATQLTAAGGHLFVIAGANAHTGLLLWSTDGTAAPQPTTLAGLASSSPIKVEGDQVYFVANDGSHGQQIWVSDGTPAGTSRVTGFANTQPFNFTSGALNTGLMELVGGRLVFVATDGTHSPGLWATSGTPQSTVALCQGACASPGQLIKVGKRLVFEAGNSSAAGLTVWSTDGTVAGTAPIAGCLPDCQPDSPLAPIGSQVYFAGGDALNQPLWRTDGTAAGTAPVPGAASIVSSYDLPWIAPLGTKLVFAAALDGGSDSNLTITDGSVAGTLQLTGGLDVGNSSYPGGFVALGNQLFFNGSYLPYGLWQSGGTAASTTPVAGSPDVVEPLRATGGYVFFVGDGQLWRTDGTASGVLQLTNLSADQQLNPQFAATFQNQIYFPGNGPAGAELWRSDGTVAGTGAATGLVPAGGTLSDGPWAAGGYLFYTVMTAAGAELWRSDGTTAGSVALAAVDIAGSQIVAAGGRVFFLSTPPTGQLSGQLWQTDGTAAGTGPLPIAGSSVILGGLTALGDAAYLFSQQVTTQGVPVSLWRSDGTTAGTLSIATFVPAEPRVGADLPAATAVVGNQLFFTVDDGIHGLEPWASDGTTAGTHLLRDIAPGLPDSSPLGYTAAGGKVYFSADDGVHGRELWESDGTASGTRMVQDIWPGPAGANPAAMTQAGGLLYFTATDGLHGTELWALPLAGPATCLQGPANLCLLDDRFQVQAFWIDSQGNSGDGQAVPLTPDTGTFWFFSPDNLELVGKAIDGTSLDGSFWFFYGALSNIEYWLTVTDTTTGAARRYFNPAGQLASVGDTAAFGPLGAASIGAPTAPETPDSWPAAGGTAGSTEPKGDTSACQPGAPTLCLTANRFAVSVTWQDFNGNQGSGTAVDLTADTGYFWFFGATNVELMLKVLDGRPVNGRFWVFYGALSDVAYTITVRDTTTGDVRTYTNPAGQFASVADTAAF